MKPHHKKFHESKDDYTTRHSIEAGDICYVISDSGTAWDGVLYNLTKGVIVTDFSMKVGYTTDQEEWEPLDEDI